MIHSARKYELALVHQPIVSAVLLIESEPSPHGETIADGHDDDTVPEGDASKCV